MAVGVCAAAVCLRATMPKRPLAVAGSLAKAAKTPRTRGAGAAAARSSAAASATKDEEDFVAADACCSMCGATPEEPKGHHERPPSFHWGYGWAWVGGQRAHPQAQAWAKYSVKKVKGKESSSSAGTKKAVGDRCADHHEFYENNLKSTFTWAAACIRYKKDTAWAEHVAQGIRISKGELSRSWDASEVGRELQVAVVVEEHGLFLSKKEFEAYTGSTPEQCRVTAVQGLSIRGDLTKGYLVADPARPFRTFTARAISLDYSRAPSLSQAQHLIPTLAKDHMAKLIQDRSSAKDLPKNILQHKVYTLKELKHRATKDAATGAGGGSGDEDDEMWGLAGDMPNLDEDEEEEEVELCAGSKPPEAVVHFTPQKGRSPGGTVCAQSVTGSGKKGGAASTVFEVSEVEAKAARKKGPGHWMEVVSIPALMVKPNLGREEGFANKCVEALLDPKTVRGRPTPPTHEPT